MTMFSLVRVELTDGAVCRMAPKALNIFLAQNKVVQFERSDGWAVVGVDPLREMKKAKAYYGYEHRVAV